MEDSLSHVFSNTSHDMTLYSTYQSHFGLPTKVIDGYINLINTSDLVANLFSHYYCLPMNADSLANPRCLSALTFTFHLLLASLTKAS